MEMQGCESPLLRLRNASDKAFCETLKHVMSCLGCWAFTRKAGERGFSEKKAWPDPGDPWGVPAAEGCWGRLPQDSCGSASGRLTPARLPESSGEGRGKQDDW